MFTGKKSDETEWSRFSKALSPRERDEGDSPPDAEPTASAQLSQSGRGEAVAAPTLTRQSLSDVNVSSRSASRQQAVDITDDVESTIGEHTTIDGTFKSENSIRVRGTVQGEIESKRAIYIDEQANVTAKVTAATITVAGQINGQIYCVGRVELRLSGRVSGEINAGTLIMHEGAFFEGNLKMGGADSTNETRTVVGGS